VNFILNHEDIGLLRECVAEAQRSRAEHGPPRMASDAELQAWKKRNVELSELAAYLTSAWLGEKS
jgi:hypothetical protein